MPARPKTLETLEKLDETPKRAKNAPFWQALIILEARNGRAVVDVVLWPLKLGVCLAELPTTVCGPS